MIISKKIQTIIDLARAGNKHESARILVQLKNELNRQAREEREKTLRLLDKVKAFYDLPDQLASHWDYVKDGVDYRGQEVLEGISLVTCCMNRTENLLKALPSWIACSEIREIVIVDWSSREPVLDSLRMAGIADPRIRIIRVDGQPRWILSYAFNLGFRVSRFDKILKTDADIIIKEGFFTKNPLVESTFISGDWRIAEKGQEHINGFFYIRRKDVMAVKGFNEYITTYGWDDDDIYNRLEESGVRRARVDTSTIYHIPHDDSQRLGVESDVCSPYEELRNNTLFKIRTNRFISLLMPRWNKDRTFLPFKVLEQTEGYVKVVQAGEPVHKVPDHIRDDAERFAAMEILSWRVGHSVLDLPRSDFLELIRSFRLEEITRERVKERLDRRTVVPPAFVTKSTRRRIYIDVQHGLGNRLRALASAAAVAEKTDRELVVIWVPDHHCECRLSDLYDYTGAVIEEAFVPDPARIRAYNYMEIEAGAIKDALIEIDEDKDLYVRSAYVLNSPLSDWNAENEQLRRLVPSKAVRDIVGRIDVAGRVGVHVRMEAGKGLDHNSWDSIENWTEESHRQIHYWREKSHYSRFIRRIDDLFREQPDLQLFVAADLKDTYEIFYRYYGERVSFVERNVFDRSREQIIYGLADAILLSRCAKLLGSSWSSFSELAMRMSVTLNDIEMSGKDF